MYEEIDLPRDSYPGYCDDMDNLVYCPGCDQAVVFGNTYTSRRYFYNGGVFGIPVCPACHKKEWKDEIRYRKDKET